MTGSNLPKRSIDHPDPAATSDPIDAVDLKPTSINAIGDFNATNETNANKVPKAVASTTNSEVLLGRFRVQKVLGEGAYGKVYLARDEQLNRLVAIKYIFYARSSSRSFYSPSLRNYNFGFRLARTR